MSRWIRSVTATGLAGFFLAFSVPAQFPIDALDRIVGSKRTVIFGEDSHGMAAVHAAVPPMFEHLVERKGFRAFVFEVQWNVTDAFRGFMASDRTTLTSMEQYYLDGAFVSDDTTAMLVWIRNWNRAHPADPISIYGYQPEQPVTDSRALDAFIGAYASADAPDLRQGLVRCKALDPELKTDLDMVLANGKLNKAGKPSYTDTERSACLAAINRIGSFLGSHDAALARAAPRRERVLARLHAISLEAYVTTLRRFVDSYVTQPERTKEQQIAAQGRIYNDGDAARFEILRGLQAEFFPRKKTFFWMHDWHAARRASEIGTLPGEMGIPKGTVSIGQRISAATPHDTVVIGNLVPCGTTCAEPAESVEPAFARKFGEQMALVDLRDRRQTTALPIRFPGAFYANQNKIGFGEVVLARQFDAILYIPKTEHVR